MKVICLAISVCFLLSPLSLTSDALFSDEPLVKESCVVEIDNYVLVCVICRPIFFKSDGLELKSRINQKMSDIYGDKEIIISFDLDVFYDLQYGLKSNNDKGIRKALEKAIERA